VCDPPDDWGTMKLELQLPVDPAVIPEVTSSPSNVTTIPVSPETKPAPLTVMELPGGPLVLLRETPELVSKLTAVTDVVELPEAFTLCVPASDAGTINELLQSPVEPAEIPVAMVVLSKIILILVSSSANPAPVTVTDVPGAPSVLLSVIIGVVSKYSGPTSPDVGP